MADRRLSDDSMRRFDTVLSEVRGARLRPEVRLEEVPAPGRLAPRALALEADVVPDRAREQEVATGRFVVLFDPDAPEQWDGEWRIVSYAKAELEPEVAGDPALGGVGWSWLEDALEGGGCRPAALAGTVTRVVSERFGALEEEASTVEMEVRASWTARSDDVLSHLVAWSEMLCTLGGLPPVPEGVAILSPRR